MTERHAIDQLLAAARARIDRFAPAQAQAARARGALLIDTRDADHRRATGTIAGAVHVPLSVLYWRLDPSSGHADPALSDPAWQVILVCAHGYSSA